jgi:type I restriction enzyme S subunit
MSFEHSLSSSSIRLGDLIDLIIDYRGKTPKKLGGDFTNSGVPVISAIHLKGGRIVWEERERFVSKEMFNKWMKEPLRKNDVLLSSEAPLGEVALVPSDEDLVLSQRLFAIRTKPNLLDPRFLKYFFKSQIGQDELKARASGSTVIGIRQSELLDVLVRCPVLEEQRVIGAVLSNLDGKIDTNERLSKSLEEIAQAIFKSWFIDFDPVKAKMNGEKPVGMDDETAALFPDVMEDSEIGPIPKGWEVSNLGQVCDIKQGKYLAPSQMAVSPQGDDTVPVIGGNGILGYTSKSTFDFDVPLVTCRGSRCGLLQWANYPSWVSNNAMAVTMQKSSDYSLFIHLFLKNTNLDNVITGSAQPQITMTNLGYTRIVMPSGLLLKAFSNLTEQMRIAVISLSEEGQTLAGIRDSLLPRLISGELQIPEEMLVS